MWLKLRVKSIHYFGVNNTSDMISETPPRCCVNDLRQTALTERLHCRRLVFLKQYTTHTHTHYSPSTKARPRPCFELPLCDAITSLTAEGWCWLFVSPPFIFSVRSLRSIQTKTPWPCVPFRHRYPTTHETYWGGKRKGEKKKITIEERLPAETQE